MNPLRSRLRVLLNREQPLPGVVGFIVVPLFIAAKHLPCWLGVPVAFQEPVAIASRAVAAGPTLFLSLLTQPRSERAEALYLISTLFSVVGGFTAVLCLLLWKGALVLSCVLLCAVMAWFRTIGDRPTSSSY